VVITLVWDEHFVSVGSKQIRKPKKDGWFEHGQNCQRIPRAQFRPRPVQPKRAVTVAPSPLVGGDRLDGVVVNALVLSRVLRECG
jgi:hypothetical protein